MWGRDDFSPPSAALLLSVLKAPLCAEAGSPLDVPGRLLGRLGEGEGDRAVLGRLDPNPPPPPKFSALASYRTYSMTFLPLVTMLGSNTMATPVLRSFEGSTKEPSGKAVTLFLAPPRASKKRLTR